MEPGDRPALEALCRVSFTRLYAHFALQGLETSRVLVARAARRALGFVQIRSILRDRVANVYFIAVDPATRGRGVGRQLLEAALGAVWASGHGYAMASVPRRNQASLRLFRGAGFQPKGFRGVSALFGVWGTLALYWEALVAPHERVLLLQGPGHSPGVG